MDSTLNSLKSFADILFQGVYQWKNNGDELNNKQIQIPMSQFSENDYKPYKL